jgi:epoxide hydrolase-like predicted phosphatase
MPVPKKSKIKIVFFDFGGVFISRTSKQTFRLASRLMSVKPAIVEDAFFRHCEAHQIGNETLFSCWNRIGQELGLSAAKAKMVSKKLIAAYRVFAKPRPSMFKIVEALKKKGVRVGLISDTCEEHAAINAKFGYYRHFDPLILSHQVRTKKPGAKIFRLALKKAGVKPSESVFIDDHAFNLEAAKRLGFHVIHFRSVNLFRRQFKRLNLL